MSVSPIHHIVLIRTELASTSDSSQVTPANTDGEWEQRGLLVTSLLLDRLSHCQTAMSTSQSGLCVRKTTCRGLHVITCWLLPENYQPICIFLQRFREISFSWEKHIYLYHKMSFQWNKNNSEVMYSGKIMSSRGTLWALHGGVSDCWPLGAPCSLWAGANWEIWTALSSVGVTTAATF